MAALSIAAVLAGATGCSSTRSSSPEASASGSAASGALIGISMPSRSLERWNADGANLDGLLKKAGYKTTLQYANDKSDQQITQIENMINQGAKVLVIAAVDGTALSPVLKKAGDSGIKVIAYDRLIKNTPNVDYYATFDNEKVGEGQGKFLIDQLGLAQGKGPFNLEPFAGSPDDNNAVYFFRGAWKLLAPYVKSGKLVVPSGKAPAADADGKSIGIFKWSSQTAQAEMDNRLNSFYAGKKVNAVLSPNDSLALGIEQSLESKGYRPGAEWPLITGQDADLANVKNILAGKQAMTVWKNFKTLGDRVSMMIDQIIKGQTVEVNDSSTYNNGVKVVPSFLLPIEVITKADVKPKLVDSGFISADKLGL